MKKRKITWRFLLNGKLAYCAGKQIIAELLDTQHIDADGKRFWIWRRQKLLPGLQIRNEVGDYLI